MNIRQAMRADAPALAQLGATAFAAKFGHLYPEAVLARYLEDNYALDVTTALILEPSRATWLAEDAGALVGFAMLTPAKLPHPGVTPACIELCRLYTDPQATGRGIGTALMHDAALPAFGAARGDAWLGVYAGNDGGQRFYARYGFEKVGTYEFPVGPIRDEEFIMRRRRA